MKFAVPPALALILAAQIAVAGIDSGGGKASLGSETLWSSIGSLLATSFSAVGNEFLFPGQIEVVYARAHPTDADIDGNGIPDFWGRFYFGTSRLNHLADDDGDGDSNLMEFLAGNNPRSPLSSYRTQASYDQGVFTLDFPTMSGRAYRVWWSADLKASWTLHEQHQGTGQQARSSFNPALHDPSYASRSQRPKYFFRVEILKP
jgi:hypothetical protein